MSENEIKLIRQQISSLETKKFDLEAWKSHTMIFISRIFGPSSEHVRLIRELKYDYSSWSLRDTSGGVQLTDPIRTRAKEILEAAITELENFGTPTQLASSSVILEIFRKELTGKEMDEMEKIMGLPDEEKVDRIKTLLSGKEKDLLISVLAQLLSHSSKQS
jgi:hypothetical protein